MYKRAVLHSDHPADIAEEVLSQLALVLDEAGHTGPEGGRPFRSVTSLDLVGVEHKEKIRSSD